MSEATEKQTRAGLQRRGRGALEPLPRSDPDPRPRAAAARATSTSTASAASGIPGLGQEAAAGGRGVPRCVATTTSSTPTAASATRWPRGWRSEMLLGDLFGRTGGSVGGKGGGTVHFVDPELGVLGQGGTLGSNFVLGAGAAISAQLLGNDRVVAVFFGDGAAARGTFHEAALQACGLEAADRLGLREQRLGALGADHRRRARPRTSPTARPPTACPGWSSTARTRSRSARRRPRRSSGRAPARGRR